MKKEELKNKYTEACNGYLEAFARKHGYCLSECRWVSNNHGGVAEIGDWYIDMQTIIDDINMNADEDEFEKWYYYSLECSEYGLVDCNFKSWILGCPRYSEEDFAILRRLSKNVDDANKLLEQSIKDLKMKKF